MKIGGKPAASSTIPSSTSNCFQVLPPACCCHSLRQSTLIQRKNQQLLCEHSAHPSIGFHQTGASTCFHLLPLSSAGGPQVPQLASPRLSHACCPKKKVLTVTACLLTILFPSNPIIPTRLSCSSFVALLVESSPNLLLMIYPLVKNSIFYIAQNQISFSTCQHYNVSDEGRLVIESYILNLRSNNLVIWPAVLKYCDS